MQDTTKKLSIQISLADEQATLALGALLAKSSPHPLVISLSGDLGAGKTTLTRGFLRAFGYEGAVKSPTFTLVESYSFNEPDIMNTEISGLHHFDLYRIEDPEELDFIGFEEYFEEQAHVIIEWPVRAGDRLGETDFDVALSHEKSSRAACLSATSERAKTWLSRQIKQKQFNSL